MPEQSGIAKRKNYSVVEAAWAMLKEKSMPKFYWAKSTTLEGFRKHCVCACAEGEAEEVGRESREVYLGRYSDE